MSKRSAMLGGCAIAFGLSFLAIRSERVFAGEDTAQDDVRAVAMKNAWKMI